MFCAPGQTGVLLITILLGHTSSFSQLILGAYTCSTQVPEKKKLLKSFTNLWEGNWLLKINLMKIKSFFCYLLHFHFPDDTARFIQY